MQLKWYYGVTLSCSQCAVYCFDRTEDFLDFIDVIKPPYMSPQCADYVNLEFSIHAFEHLEVIKDTSKYVQL